MKVSIISVNCEENLGQKVDNFYFDNDVWVGITPSEHQWEMQHDDNEESYASGNYFTDENVVIDFDGCYSLPKEVRKALQHKGYKLFI